MPIELIPSKVYTIKTFSTLPKTIHTSTFLVYKKSFLTIQDITTNRFLHVVQDMIGRFIDVYTALT